MRVYLGADHAGFEFKKTIIEHLEKNGHEPMLGGSGNGEQIAANKVPGARCALAWSVETAQLARQHNNAQLIGIGGRMHTTEEAPAIVDAFLSTPWSEAEHPP